MALIWRQDLRLNAEIAGPEGAPAIVFLHALGTDLHLWDACVAALSLRFRCLRFDGRGHGRSDVPPPVERVGR